MGKFLSAFMVGERDAMDALRSGLFQQTPEQVIFEAMEHNPYKSEQARKEYIAGVSSWVNTKCRLDNRMRNEVYRGNHRQEHSQEASSNIDTNYSL